MNEIFSIFNPDWWMDENNNALQITDAILFLFLCLPVLYLFICALFSLGKYKNPYPPALLGIRNTDFCYIADFMHWACYFCAKKSLTTCTTAARSSSVRP
mgnify:FL=1